MISVPLGSVLIGALSGLLALHKIGYERCIEETYRTMPHSSSEDRMQLLTTKRLEFATKIIISGALVGALGAACGACIVYTCMVLTPSIGTALMGKELYAVGLVSFCKAAALAGALFAGLYTNEELLSYPDRLSFFIITRLSPYPLRWG